MTLILKSLVCLPLVLMLICIMYVFKNRAWTIDDFRVEQVTYSKVYIETYGTSRRYQNIEIVAGEKQYSLFPSDEFIPEGMTLESIANLLKRSSDATIWIEEEGGLHLVRGIRTQYLDISPTRGIKFHENERVWAQWGAAACLAISIFCYLYFKQYYKLDWKLNFKTQ